MTITDPESDREARRAVTQTVAVVSRHLGNTPAVCRRSSVHPAVIDAFRSGDLSETWARPTPRLRGLVADERKLLALLEAAAAADSSPARAEAA